MEKKQPILDFPSGIEFAALYIVWLSTNANDICNILQMSQPSDSHLTWFLHARAHRTWNWPVAMLLIWKVCLWFSCRPVAIISTLGKFKQFSWSMPLQKQLFKRLSRGRRTLLEDFGSNVPSGSPWHVCCWEKYLRGRSSVRKEWWML